MSGEVTVSPNDLRFRFQLNKQLTATITISNSSDYRVAYKVKTTTPKKYVVRPSTGVCNPRSSAIVQVIMQAQKDFPEDGADLKDKFLVLTKPLRSDEDPEADVFRNTADKSISQTKLKVILEAAAEPPSPVAEEPDEAHHAPDHRLDDKRIRSTMQDLSAATHTINTITSQRDQLARQCEDMQRKLDALMARSMATSSSSQPKAAVPASTARITFVHLIIVAIIAFLLGHFT